MKELSSILNLDSENNNYLTIALHKIKSLNETQFIKWLKNLPEVLINYKKKYALKAFKVYSSSRLGLIIEASSKYGIIIMKIIPKYLNIYEIEANAYRRLSKKYICPVIDLDDNNCILLLKKLDCHSELSIDKNKKELESFFDIVFQNATIAKKNELKYIDVLTNNIKMLDRDNKLLLYKKYEKEVLNIYQHIFVGKTLYLLHADLHKGNILKDQDSYYAIDPLGYCAPLEFSFIRYITVELLFSDNIKANYTDLISFMEKYFNKELLIKALYIDTYLLLTSLLIQIKNSEAYIKKIVNILDFVRKKI